MLGESQMKKVILCTIGLFLLACQSKPATTSTPVPPTATAVLPTATPIPSTATAIPPTPTLDTKAEEYVVYVVLLAATYPSDLTIVIRDHTSTSYESPDEGLKKTLDYIKKQMPTIAADTLENFEAINQQEYPLVHSFAGYHCVLVSDNEMKEIFSTDEGWDKFYKLYPHSQGHMTLSRVGFNRDMNQALVYVGNVSDLTVDAGYYVLLQKINGHWYIQNQVNTWIS
jgi:hypothetical protein